MALRLPPGRAGRIWLVRRLEVAERGIGVLEEKRQALLRESERLAPLVEAAEAEWRARAEEAAAWLGRADVLSGRRRLQLARTYAGIAPELEVEWRNVLGVDVPDRPRVVTTGRGASVPAGGSSALPIALARHREALEAAARAAALRAAQTVVSAELRATTRRIRAIEKRWVPLHAEALASLSLTLDEAEREDAIRARWAGERRRSAAAGHPAQPGA